MLYTTIFQPLTLCFMSNLTLTTTPWDKYSSSPILWMRKECKVTRLVVEGAEIDLRAFQKYCCACSSHLFTPLPLLTVLRETQALVVFNTKYPQWFLPRVQSHCSGPVVLKLHCLLESSGELPKLLHSRLIKSESLGQYFLKFLGLFRWQPNARISVLGQFFSNFDVPTMAWGFC